MMDDEDFQRESEKFYALVASRSGRSLPPGASEVYFAMLLARMRATTMESGDTGRRDRE